MYLNDMQCNDEEPDSSAPRCVKYFGIGRKHNATLYVEENRTTANNLKIPGNNIGVTFIF